MRLVELTIKNAGGSARAVLSGPRHCVLVPREIALRAFRDALGAALYGAEHFPGGARGGLRGASILFDVNGVRYRIAVDLTTGRRQLLQEAVGHTEVLAEQAGAIDQALGALLHLPSALVYRSLCLDGVEFPATRLPAIPAGAHRAVLAHAERPETLRTEVDAAAARVEAARLALRGAGVAPPWRRPTAIASALVGLGALSAAGWAQGGARMLGLLAPGFFGVAAWRALQWVDAGEGRGRALKAVEEAEAVARARRRHHDEMEGAVAALERVVGSRRPEALAAILDSLAETALPELLVDHVEVFAGDPPDPRHVAQLVEAFATRCKATAAAGLVVAAAEGRGERCAPLLWTAPGEADAGIPWGSLFQRVAPSVPILVFRHAVGPDDLAVALRPVTAGAP